MNFRGFEQFEFDLNNSIGKIRKFTVHFGLKLARPNSVWHGSSPAWAREVPWRGGWVEVAGRFRLTGSEAGGGNIG
jgi:hypothetical protein